MPVATLTVGWPAKEPPLSDRLPLESFVHQERYNDYTGADIDTYYNRRSSRPSSARASCPTPSSWLPASKTFAIMRKEF